MKHKNNIPKSKHKGNMENIKVNKKYVTINENGMDFRKMSKIMTMAGFSMNHATTRNILITAIETLIIHASTSLKTKIKRRGIKELILSQDMHDDLADVIYVAYKELQEEGKL